MALHEGYRVIRLLAGDADSPWPGALVCGPTGDTAVAVDASLLDDSWAGWAAAPTGHVLAPLEILRRREGHDVLLPVCTERVEDFLLRRGRTGADLTTGEGVTIAVSLIRGLGELQGVRQGACGTWWLTDGGRPVFATDTSQSTLEAHTVELLRRVEAEVASLSEALADVIEAIPDPRRRARELERAEASLFAAAEPAALATTTFGPKRARDRVRDDAGEQLDGPEPERMAWPVSLARHIDADWADLVSRTTTALWRAVRTRRPGARRPWLVASGLACAIVVGGLLWPTGESPPATADAAPSAPAAAPSMSTPPPAIAESDVAEEAEPTDLVSIAAALLTARMGCAGESVCLENVLETSAVSFPSGVIDLEEADRSLVLLDEFGGAAVLRAEAVAPGPAPQLVVIVFADDRWLLRDVYDVTNL